MLSEPCLINSSSSNSNFSTGQLTAEEFELGARLLASAWCRPSWQETTSTTLQAATQDKQACQSLSVAMRQSCWQVATIADNFGLQDTVYLKMEGLPHTCPTAVSKQQQQQQQQLSLNAQGACSATKAVSFATVTNPIDALKEADDDDASVMPSNAPTNFTHLYDIHVLLHPTYGVPTLYMRGKTTEGTPLPWSDVEKDFPHWQSLRGQYMGSPAGWALITAVDSGHPLLSGIQRLHWLMIHPCNTANIMQVLTAPRSGSQQPAGGNDAAFQNEEGGNQDDAPDIEEVEALQSDDGRLAHTTRADIEQSQQSVAVVLSGDQCRGHQYTGCRYERDEGLLFFFVSWLNVVVGPILGLQLSVSDVQHLLSHTDTAVRL